VPRIRVLVQTWLALRSLFWTILIPGIVAGYVPWTFFGLRRTRRAPAGAVDLLALLFILAGTLLLVACIFEFARSGRGTLSPVDRLAILSFVGSIDTSGIPCT